MNITITLLLVLAALNSSLALAESPEEYQKKNVVGAWVQYNVDDRDGRLLLIKSDLSVNRCTPSETPAQYICEKITQWTYFSDSNDFNVDSPSMNNWGRHNKVDETDPTELNCWVKFGPNYKYKKISDENIQAVFLPEQFRGL
jgi:hypothetical protein